MMRCLLLAVVTAVTPTLGIELVVDGTGEPQSLLRKEVGIDKQPTIHPCDDQTTCKGCGGLSQAACEKACWVDGNKKNR
eukprot:symbB.v1.2.004401.t1/scaffold247.1/size253962/1